MKAALDMSARFLVLSDIRRNVRIHTHDMLRFFTNRFKVLYLQNDKGFAMVIAEQIIE